MRKLPTYILIDTSGSMKGEPIEAVKVGLQTLVNTLRQNPYALETVALSFITFDREVKTLLSMTELDKVRLPEITTPDVGATFTGEALAELCSRYDREVRRSTPDSKGDWKPIVIILTDGKPSDTLKYKRQVEEVKQRGFGNIVACAAGMKASTESLKMLTDNVYHLDTMDSGSFESLFKWITDVINTGSKTVGSIAAEAELLPPPPEEITAVL